MFIMLLIIFRQACHPRVKGGWGGQGKRSSLLCFKASLLRPPRVNGELRLARYMLGSRAVETYF